MPNNPLHILLFFFILASLGLVGQGNINECFPPTFTLAEPTPTGNVRISWQGNAKHNKYHVQYRKQSAVGSATVGSGQFAGDSQAGGSEQYEWFEVYTSGGQAQISNLQPGVTYEFRVGGTCNALTQLEQSYTYTSINTFTMPTADESVSYSCGIVPEINITNTTPLENIGVNETFTAGDFPVTVKQIQGGNGVYSGTGFIVVPYLADTKIAVEFNSIAINTDYQLIDGIIQTTYDAQWGGSINVLVSGLQDDVNNILDLLDNYTGSDEDIAALQEALDELNNGIDNIQGNANIPNEIKDLLSDELQDSFNSTKEDLIAQGNSPQPETIKDNKDQLSQIKEAMTNMSDSLNASSEQGDRTDDPTGFFDGYLPLKNNDTALTIKNLDNGGTFTIPIKASNENQSFYESPPPFELNGTTYTIIYTSSISSTEDIEKARAKVNTPENGVVIYYHYDTDNNRLGYKVEVDRAYFGKNMSDEDFNFSKQTFKEGLNNLIAELKAVDDWSAEIFEITVGLNNRIKQLLDNIVLPEELWNPDKYIDEIPFRFQPLPAGLIDGVLEEVKSVPLLISLVIDYNTSEETQQKIDSLVSDFDFTDAMNKWYEGRKEHYANDPIHLIEYKAGKDVVEVASILTGAGAALKTVKKGSDFIEGLVGQVKKKLIKKIGTKINFASKIDNVVDAISDTSKNADEVLEELSKTNKVGSNNQVTGVFKKFWQQHEANVSNYLNKTYGLLNVGRQITVDIYITGKGKVTCRLDNLVKLDNGMFKIIDAKSSILQDLSTKEVSKLIGEFSTKNQKAFYEALKNGTIEKITPRGQRAIDYFKIDLKMENIPENLNIEKTIDFYVNDAATSGYGIYKTTY